MRQTAIATGIAHSGESMQPRRRLHRQRAGDVRGRVGADGVEGDVTEVEQAGPADDHVEADGQQDVDADVGDQRLLPERASPSAGRTAPARRRTARRSASSSRRRRGAAGPATRCRNWSPSPSPAGPPVAATIPPAPALKSAIAQQPATGTEVLPRPPGAREVRRECRGTDRAACTGSAGSRPATRPRSRSPAQPVAGPDRGRGEDHDDGEEHVAQPREVRAGQRGQRVPGEERLRLGQVQFLPAGSNQVAVKQRQQTEHAGPSRPTAARAGRPSPAR